MMLSNMQSIALDIITTGHRNHNAKDTSAFRLSPLISMTSL